jgi:hypothetical protein
VTLRQLGRRDASAVQEADALWAWVRDNVPNQALRISIRRNGYGFLLDRSLDGCPGEVPDRPIAAQAERLVRRSSCQFVHVTPVRGGWSHGAMFHRQAGSRS